MFKKVLAYFKSAESLKEMLEEFSGMLETGEWMFDKVGGTLFGTLNCDAILDDIYAKDKEINETERNVRRRIVQHIAIVGCTNLHICLVLMSVVKDAERVGDYYKNIFEISQQYQRTTEFQEYVDRLQQLHATTRDMFPKVRQAFLEDNRIAAGEMLDLRKDIGRKADQIVDELLISSLPANAAISYSLLARFFKRVASHLGNIASSIVQPLHYLDFSEPVKG